MSHDIFKDLTEHEASTLQDRIDSLGISREQLNSTNLPYTIIENLTDEDLLGQISITNSNFSKPEEPIVDEEPIEESVIEDTVDEEPIVEEEPKKEVKPKATRKPRASKKQVEIKEEIDEYDDDDEDLSNIRILDVSSHQAYNNYQQHLSLNFPTYEVTLPQSGYNAKLRGLTADEIDILKNSINASFQSSREDLINIVYRCIKHTGLPQFTKQDFEEYTSFLDFNILLFGIMHQTYGALNDFDFVCPHCNERFQRKIITDTLIKNTSEVIGERIEDITAASDKTIPFKNSLLRKFNKRLRIPETDFIIDIRLSNLNKDKKMMGHFSKLSDKEKDTRKFYLTMLISKLYLPQYSEDSKVIGYVEITTPTEIYKFLDSVKSKSYNKILPKINKILEDLTIHFELPDLPCPNCSGVIQGSRIELSEYFLLEVVRDGLLAE